MGEGTNATSNGVEGRRLLEWLIKSEKEEKKKKTNLMSTPYSIRNRRGEGKVRLDDLKLYTYTYSKLMLVVGVLSCRRC